MAKLSKEEREILAKMLAEEVEEETGKKPKTADIDVKNQGDDYVIVLRGPAAKSALAAFGITDAEDEDSEDNKSEDDDEDEDEESEDDESEDEGEDEDEEPVPPKPVKKVAAQKVKAKPVADEKPPATHRFFR